GAFGAELGEDRSKNDRPHLELDRSELGAPRNERGGEVAVGRNEVEVETSPHIEKDNPLTQPERIRYAAQTCRRRCGAPAKTVCASMNCSHRSYRASIRRAGRSSWDGGPRRLIFRPV